MKARKLICVWAVKHEGRIAGLWRTRELAREDARQANAVTQGGQPWYVEEVPILGEDDVLRDGGDDGAESR